MIRSLFLALLASVLAGCVTSPPELTRHEYTRPQMGLPFRVVLYAADKTAADAAANAAFARIQQLNDILSDYDADSELSRLSQTAGSGKTIPVSEELWRMLLRSQQMARETDGAFDITCGPVVSLWRKARREKKLPDPMKLAEARSAVGYEKLRLHPQRRAAELTTSYMRLDLGAIAKGYAVDEALKVLRRHGIRSALVSGGGDLAVSDAPPHEKGWRIELAPLDETDARKPAFALLNNAALATSGDLFQHLAIDGKRYSHIVDPRTGLGLTDQSLVVVIARDCMTADALSTSVSVLGPARGLQLVERHRACARVVRKPGPAVETHTTPCFSRYLER